MAAMKLEPWVHRVLAFAFGGVFIYAGVLKAWNPTLFLADVRSFQLLPDPLAAWLALALPWMEILAGAAVITGLARQGGLLLLNLALVAFFIAIASAWWRGIDIQCGCFGGGKDAAANYTWLFIRDLLLLAAGLALMWLENRRLSSRS